MQVLRHKKVKKDQLSAKNTTYLYLSDIYYILIINQVTMTTEEIFGEIVDAIGTLTENHEKTTKISSTRARKACSELGKLLKEYRKASLEETK